MTPGSSPVPSSSSLSPPLSLDSSSVERTSADESTLWKKEEEKENTDKILVNVSNV